ncbi:MAG: carboxypeptidase-like regulatory domain-containing protein [Chthoniobacteraceae bacterium]
MNPLRHIVPFLVAAFSAHGASESFEVSEQLQGELPRGKEADGIVGDFILRNDQIEAVISGNLPLRRANMSTFYGATGITPGCLYDLTLRGANNDQLTVFCPTAQQGAVSWVRVAKDGSEGEAVIETMVTGPSNKGLEIKHQYRLKDGWQGLSVTTTLRNQSSAAIKHSTTDRWTTFKRTGTAFGVLWADAIDPADRAGYAQGVTANPNHLTPGQAIELAPGGEISFTRFLAVGTSPAQAFGVVAAQRGEVGTIAGRVTEKSGAPVSGAQVAVRAVGEVGRTIGFAYPNGDGAFEISAPPGDYELTFEDAGRAPVLQKVTVSAGEKAEAAAELAPATVIAFDIQDELGRAIPCKAGLTVAP